MSYDCFLSFHSAFPLWVTLVGKAITQQFLGTYLECLSSGPLSFSNKKSGDVRLFLQILVINDDKNAIFLGFYMLVKSHPGGSMKAMLVA